MYMSCISFIASYVSFQVGPIPGVPTGEAHIHETPLGPLVHDFYRTDAVSRASVTMAKTSALHRKTATNWIL